MMITELDPGADPRLAAVFAAASAPAELPLAGELEALTAYRRSHGRSRIAGLLGPRPVHLVVAALCSGVVLAGGVATAATGSMPIVGHLHSAPTPTTRSSGETQNDDATSAGSDRQRTDDETDGANDIGDSGPGTAGHPAADHTLGSVARGAATCTAASHGTCQAGQHGKALAAHTHRRGHAPGAHVHGNGRTHHRTGHRAGSSGLRRSHGTTHHSG